MEGTDEVTEPGTSNGVGVKPKKIKKEQKKKQKLQNGDVEAGGTQKKKATKKVKHDGDEAENRKNGIKEEKVVSIKKTKNGEVGEFFIALI